MLFEFLDAAVPEVLFLKLYSLREPVNGNYCCKPIGFDICHLQPRESYDCLPLHLIDKDIEAQREVQVAKVGMKKLYTHAILKQHKYW